MPTVAAGASATITLPAGRTFTDSGGAGWVTVFGPGQSAGQTYALLNNGALGPYAEDRSIYISAQQAVEYSVDGPPSPVGVLPSGQMVNIDTLSPVSGGVVDVSAADVNNDVAPASPGEYPNSLTKYIVPAGGGPAPGFKLVWIPPTHASLPALRGWRYEFAPSETVV